MLEAWIHVVKAAEGWIIAAMFRTLSWLAAGVVAGTCVVAAQAPSPPSSVAAAQQSLRRTPSASAASTLALAYDAANDTARALAAVEDGLRRWPGDPRLLVAQGRIDWRLLRTASAERALTTATASPAVAAEAHYWLGRIDFFKGYLAEGAFPGWHEEVAFRPRALAAFTAARAARPDWALPLVGLADIARAEGRQAEAAQLMAQAVALDASLATPPAADRDAQVVLDALRAGQHVDVLAKGDAFVAAHPGSRRVLDVYDAMLVSMAATSTAPLAQVRRVIDARLALRPDPMSAAAAANVLLARRADLARVAAIATAGRAAGERFIRENEGSYKLDGKVQGSLDRNAALFADLSGWAAYLRKDVRQAERLLAEAARLSRGVDVTNQMHLGQLSRDQKQLETARDHYLTVLGLAAAPPPVRDQARTSLAAVQVALGERPEAFDRWLAETLDRQRDERRQASLGSLAGKPAPALKLTDLQGHPVDLEAERGNVVLLNFFSAW